MKMMNSHTKFVIFGLVSICCYHFGSAEKCCESGCKENKPLSITATPRLLTYEWMPLAKWYRMHADDVEEAEKGEAKVVLVGDSITEGWQWGDAVQWNKYLVPLGTANQGIGGDMTQNVLWRLDHGDVGNLKPERVICLIGTNNFGHTQETPEQVAPGVIAVVKKLTDVFPNAQILAFAVFPRSENPEHPDRAKIKKLNELIKCVGDWDQVTFMDIGDRFLNEDGSISKDIMFDYLHLTPAGYEIWAKAILDWMAETPLTSTAAE